MDISILVGFWEPARPHPKWGGGPNGDQWIPTWLKFATGKFQYLLLINIAFLINDYTYNVTDESAKL